MLAEVIGYPEPVPPGTRDFRFVVDSAEVLARADENRLVLSRRIASADAVDLAEFAGFAAGRVLKEEAVLTYDPEADALILWQELPLPAEAAVLRRFFETFVTSCDWWSARADGASARSSIPEMMIRP